MSGYVEAGYVVALATLAVYAGSLRRRELALRRRLGPRQRPGGADRVTSRPSGVDGGVREEGR